MKTTIIVNPEMNIEEYWEKWMPPNMIIIANEKNWVVIRDNMATVLSIEEVQAIYKRAEHWFFHEGGNK